MTIQVGTLLREQEYFDREALETGDDELRILPDQIERYRYARWHPLNTAKDSLFASLLPLAGKRALDYGCGMGDLACELALCGAEVSAFDLSVEAIAKAKRRAELHGVADRTRFQVGQAGQLDYPSASFEVITGVAILHHLHTELPAIYAEVDRLLTSHGVACFIEPVANSAGLRFLRRMVPVKCHATPDERQLYYSDLEPLKRHFSRLEVHHFYCLERLKRVMGGWVSPSLSWVDHYAQRLAPFLRRYYGVVLVVARR
jgi:ubiquinone/menaquinone biosynthesis C-methylase UbiE